MATQAGSMTGRRVVITGATSGIGRATARALAARGAELTLVCRNPSKARETLAELEGDAHAIVQADLERLADVERAADEILADGQPIHVLVNNAGMIRLGRNVNADGFETTFAVNHLAPFVLTNRLLGRLRDSGPARIVNVASDAHRFTGGPLDFDNLQAERRYRAFAHYGTTKLCNLLFTFELARRLEGSGVTANAVHPGMVATSLGSDNGLLARAVWALLRPFSRSPEQGAQTSIHLCTAEALGDSSGGYYYDCKPHRPAAYALDVEDAQRLWQLSCEMTGLACV
jgi:NAD(P)-dependent dehydrogenase (short-subunit alcohol dehydrogenase family)